MPEIRLWVWQEPRKVEGALAIHWQVKLSENYKNIQYDFHKHKKTKKCIEVELNTLTDN